MKNLSRANVLMALFLLLTACGQAIEIAPSNTPSSTATSAPTVTSISSMSPTPTIQPTFTPLPTLLPTIEPALIPDLLSSAFMVQILDGINGHNIHKITGWEYGFYPSSFCRQSDWLDNDHLLLFPIIGQKESFGTYSLTNPVIINHTSGKVWLPPIPENFPATTCPTYHFRWSERLGIMVMAKNDKVGAYAPNGDLLRSFGKFPEQLGLNLSPSGTKAVFGTVWIDLQTGKTVKIRSQEEIGFSAWSSDETQLFGCCYYYGNINTGKGYKFEFEDGLRVTGRGGPLGGIDILWADDTYALINYDFRADGFVDIPFIDPVTKTYKDIHDLTNIPRENYCGGRFLISPDKEYLWTNCGGQGYLITLASFEAASYDDLWLTSWSNDGRFALVGEYNSDEQQILFLSNNILSPLSLTPTLITLTWHPTDGTLAYLTKEGSTLVTMDVESESFQETALPLTFRNLVWSPTGAHIALTAADNSLWKIDYPGLEIPEQLTPSWPFYTDYVSWSPDSTYLSFISGLDIYVVEITK